MAGAERGGYVLWEAEAVNGARPDLIMIATGSEVAPTLEAAKRLEDESLSARVVSLPCWELFEEQPVEYRDSVLPPEVDARIAVEAGVSLGWHKWVADGASVSIERFGASAPGTTVLEKFGFTPENIANRAQALLDRRQRV